MEIKPGQHWTGKDKAALKTAGWPTYFVVESIGDMGMVTVKGDPNLRGFGKYHDHYQMTDMLIEFRYDLVKSQFDLFKHKILDCFKPLNYAKYKFSNRKR